MRVLTIACALALMGCAANAQSKEELGCIVLGFKLGTETYGNCVVQSRIANAAEKNSRANALGASQAVQGNIYRQMQVNPGPIPKLGQ